MNKTKLFTIIGSVILTVAIGAFSVFAEWNNPIGVPPAGNAPAPINAGGTEQTKLGTFIASALGVQGWDSQLYQGVDRAGLRKSIGGAKGWNANMLYVNGWNEWTSGVAIGSAAHPSTLNVTGDINMGASRTLTAFGRMHIDGTEKLYLLNDGGVIVSNAWGGNGNLTVDGKLTASQICLGGVCKNAWPVPGNPTDPGSPYTPGEWFNDKLTIRSGDDDSWGWGVKKSDSFVAAHAIDRIRLRGSTDDGGYCYAYWRKGGIGLGHAETVRHSGDRGYYTLSNDYYPMETRSVSARVLQGNATRTGVGDDSSFSCAAYPGTVMQSYNVGGDPDNTATGCFTYTCPAGESADVSFDVDSGYSARCLKLCPGNSFDSDGNVKLCQINWGAGPLATVDRSVSIPEGATVYLEGRHTRGVENDSVDCELDIQYAP